MFIKVNYKYSDNIFEIKKELRKLKDIFAADFEIASAYTKKEKINMQSMLENNNNIDFETKRQLQQKINSDGLSHPSLTTITHLSLACSEDTAFVIICNNSHIRKIVLEFLVTTPKKQIWHNACFDFSHIYYHNNKLPLLYEDTQLLCKALKNDVDSFKSNTRLKDLMANYYGDWAISKDNFTLEEMYNEDMLRYTAIDSCATYKLYKDYYEYKSY